MMSSKPSNRLKTQQFQAFNRPFSQQLVCTNAMLGSTWFFRREFSVFDYGCGKGDDIRNLTANAIPVSGWDHTMQRIQTKQPADIVNLGFVINVIESYQERLDALLGAYSLTQQVLVVSAMLVNQNAFRGQAFNDGVITQRNTFQNTSRRQS